MIPAPGHREGYLQGGVLHLDEGWVGVAGGIRWETFTSGHQEG